LMALAAYTCVLLLLRGGGRLVPVVALAVVLQLLPLVGPTLLSRDAYTYWAYGRVGAAHEANPYKDAPARWPDDPATIQMGSSWREQPSLYGPVFTLISERVADVAGESAPRASGLFRGIAALSILAIIGLAALLAHNKAFAVAFVGLNPLVALHFGGGGHNDALMIALVMAALVLQRAGRDSLGGLAWALSALVKWVSLAFLALVVIGERRKGGRRTFAWSAFWLVALSIGATVLYGTEWLGAAKRLSEQARRTSSIGLSGWLGDLGLSHRPTVAAIGLLTLIVAGWLAAQAWRGRVRLGLAGVLLAALQGWLNPWYALWGLALAAPEEDRTAHVLAVALSGFLFLDALPV
jgi:alpha-1,6-mannosyltransferase